MQMMFNFHVNQHLFYALASADIGPLAAALKKTKNGPRRRSGVPSFATTMSCTLPA